MAITPMRQIRKFCRECMNSYDDCLSPLCALYPFRPAANNGRKVWHTVRADGFGKTKEVELNTLNGIRHQCIECFGFDNYREQIRTCISKECPLWSFRFGFSVGKAKRRGLVV